MGPLSFPGIHNFHKDAKNVALAKNAALKNLFSALLFANDEYSFSVAGRILAEYGMGLDRVRSVRELQEKISRGRFDLAIVDADDPDILRVSCFGPASRWRGVSIALRGTRSIPLEHLRVHLLLPKPLTSDLVTRGLKAVYSTMARQKLLTFRHPVALQPLYANLLYHGRQRTLERATVLNLSQTGLCLSAPFSLPAGAIVRANLPLPESMESVNISGTVVWSDDSGRAGLEFHQLSTFERRKLEEHLKSRLPWRLDLPA
jgi:PilZ domain-containing protein